MVTDPPPRARAPLAEYEASDRLAEIDVPGDESLRAPARAIESALAAANRTAIESACARLAAVAARFYGVDVPPVKVLAARPLRVSEDGWGTELFGDYDLESGLIRVWMRTAVRKEVTSFGTLLSTLTHEICHHLDCRRFGFSRTPHTRGFYERAAALYHDARGTPRKRLYWVAMGRGRWRIDWVRTRRGV
jgi:hypothetical protein